MSDDPNESDLLIDFNNSVSSRSNALDLKVPSLLPPPCNSAVSNPSDVKYEENNPFDLAISKTFQHASSANDPFEIVFEKASKASCEKKPEDTNNAEPTALCVNNNPFDLVISETLQHTSSASDPFEIVFEKASKTSCEKKAEDKDNAETTAVPCVNNSIVSEVNKSKFSNSTTAMDLNLLREKLAALVAESKNNTNCLGKMDGSLVTNINDITDPTGQTLLNLTNVSLQMSFIDSELASAIEGSSVCQSNSKVNLILDANQMNKATLSSEKDSSSDSSLQRSKTINSQSVEEIKAMVAKRVSICIQNALEDSKHAVNIPHRRALSLSSINPIPTKNSSFTNDYCDAPPIKPAVKDLKTELERIKASWKNCSYHQSAFTSSLPSNVSKSSALPETLPTKPALHPSAPRKTNNISDSLEGLTGQGPRTLDSEKQKNKDTLELSPTTMGIVFEEALVLSEYFQKLSESCSFDLSDDDLLNSTPPWEKCSLVLPELGSDEDDLQALATSWQKLNLGNSLDGAKKSPTRSFKESPEKEKPKFQSCPTTPILSSSSSSKADSASATPSEHASAHPPFSDEKEQRMTLRSRLSSILSKNALPSKPELPATPPVPVKVVADEEGKTEIKLRPKRKETVGKKGPMKAVVPLDNMTRQTSTTKKSAAVKVQPSTQRQPVLSGAPLQGKRSPSYSSKASSNSPASTPPAVAESRKGKSSSPNYGFQGKENRRYSSPKGGTVSATQTAQVLVHHSGSHPEVNRVTPASGAPSRNVATSQKQKTNISPTTKTACKTTASTESQSKPSNAADTSSNVVTSTPVKNPQIPKFQSSPIYHTDSKEKEAGFQRSQLNVDGTSSGNAKSTTSNVNSKKKLIMHTRSRSLGNVQNKNEKPSASSENKQSSSMTGGAKSSKIAASILKPLAMLKPTSKLTNRMSSSGKAKDDDKTKTTTWMIAKMRRSGGASQDKENLKPL